MSDHVDDKSSVTIWSVQAYSGYERLLQGEPIRGSYERVDGDYRDKYAWMAQKMVEFGVAERPVCPVWGWYAWGGTRRRKPDLRSSWHLPPGEVGVRLEIRLPARRVLLSQFEMWVGVLNGHYIGADSSDVELFDRAGTSKQLRESWCRIFDMQFGGEDLWGALDERAIQATVPHITREMVVDETVFVAR